MARRIQDKVGIAIKIVYLSIGYGIAGVVAYLMYGTRIFFLYQIGYMALTIFFMLLMLDALGEIREKINNGISDREYVF